MADSAAARGSARGEKKECKKRKPWRALFCATPRFEHDFLRIFELQVKFRTTVLRKKTVNKLERRCAADCMWPLNAAGATCPNYLLLISNNYLFKKIDRLRTKIKFRMGACLIKDACIVKGACLVVGAC